MTRGGWQRLALLICIAVPAPATAADVPQTPRALLMTPMGPAAVEFDAIGDDAVLTAHLPDGRTIPLRMVSSVSDALAILADPRLAFAWPQLVAWAGPGLSGLRDRAVARARFAIDTGTLSQVPRTTAEYWAGDAAVTAALQYSSALVAAGDRDGAIAWMRKSLDAVPTDPDHADARTFLTERLSSLLFSAGDHAAALALLQKLIGATPERDDVDLNAVAQLAHLLAIDGQYAPALTLIDLAWRRFRSAKVPEDREKVPDADASFAFIKACALAGLDRKGEADELMATIAAKPDDAAHSSLTAGARIGGFACMHDADALAGELAAQVSAAPPASDVFVTIQPGRHDDGAEAAVYAAALRKPRLVAAVARHARNLPSEFDGAVRQWHKADPSVTDARRAR